MPCPPGRPYPRFPFILPFPTFGRWWRKAVSPGTFRRGLRGKAGEGVLCGGSAFNEFEKVVAISRFIRHLLKVSALAFSGESRSGRTPHQCSRLKINPQQHNEVLSSLKKLLVSTRWLRNMLTIV